MDPWDDDTSTHNRRYMILSAILAIVVLGIAAVSITVVITQSP